MISNVAKQDLVKEEQGVITCTDVTCPVCGMSCDDCEIELTPTSVTTKNACLMGDAKFQELRSAHRLVHPVVNGERVSWGGT